MRRLPLVVGVVALLAGGALALGVGPSLPSEMDTLPFVLAVLVGGALAVVGMLVRSTEGASTEPLPEPGVDANARVPGQAVDRKLANVSWRETETRMELEDRGERAAVATLARVEGRSPAEARERLASGDWTDDERAARLLDDESRPPSTGEKVRALATGETPFQRDAAALVATLHQRAEDDRP